MAKKSMAKTLALRSAFDNTGQVRDAKTFAVAVFYHTKIGGDGGECVAGDLWLGRCDDRKQRGLARIRKANKSYISENFQFKYFPSFKAWFTGLCMFRRLVGGCCEMGIAETAPSAGYPYHFLAVFQYLHFLFAGFFISRNSA
jgi:hypothetical protein